ncbi:CoA transferase [Nonomuraea sp. 10N515B]|uniref:CoA transferase n=1 Tax=Nonomuraea sp. 10N515B TaxID=3457422 RepID=UPI003FCD66FC
MKPSLDGVRVVALAGQGPVPFAGMILADLGADVIRIDRPDAQRWADHRRDVMGRGSPST